MAIKVNSMLTTLSLDQSGLRGKGGFDYLSSTTQSDDYIFFPDSMNTHANTFDLERTANIAEFPQASGKTIYEHWRPYDDVLMVEKRPKIWYCILPKQLLTVVFIFVPLDLQELVMYI